MGTTCSNLTGAVYSSSNDAWGNVTSRTYNGSTATLSYDLLDQLVQWNAGASSQEWYAYDLGGNRTLRRSTTGSGTTLTVYAFGLEEHVYSSSGTPQSSTYYYPLGGRLIGELQGSTTQFFLTDALGSVITTFNATANSAAVQGNQLYGPYGNHRYSKGSMGTNKGFTGQYADATGLDYDNARYYDPVIGRFLSADTVQGNLQGTDPYGYVSGNPETLVDPTGRSVLPVDETGGEGNPGDSTVESTVASSDNLVVTETPLGTEVTVPGQQADVSTTIGDTTYQLNPETGQLEKVTDDGSGGRTVTQVDPNSSEYQDVVNQLDNSESDQSFLSQAKGHQENEPQGTTPTEPQGTSSTAATTNKLTVYRGTDRVNEINAYKDSGGYVMSDAATSSYTASRADGNSVAKSFSNAYADSMDALDKQVEYWGSQDEYVLQHDDGNAGKIGPRPMMSWTTSTSVARGFAGPDGVVFQTQAFADRIIFQSMLDLGEGELLIPHIIKATLLH